MIDRRTGALILSNARISRDLTRSSFLSTPMGERAHHDDMKNGWMHVHLEPQVLGELTFGIDILFESERLDGYRLVLIDSKYGTSWTIGPRRRSSRSGTRTTRGSCSRWGPGSGRR